MKNSTLIYSSFAVATIIGAGLFSGLAREGHMDKAEYLIKNVPIQIFTGPLIKNVPIQIFAGPLINQIPIQIFAGHLINNVSIEKFAEPFISSGFMSEEFFIVQHATIGFKLENFVSDPTPEIEENGDEYFANVISQCVFHSSDSFEPLCVICKLKDSEGKIVGAGIVGETFDKDYVASSIVDIDIEPTSENPASQDVQKIHDVKVEICKEKENEGDVLD